MCLYDLRMQDPDKAALIRDRAREVEGKILGSVQEVAVHSDIILSLVTPEASVAVAGEAAAHLKPGQHRQAC